MAKGKSAEDETIKETPGLKKGKSMIETALDMPVDLQALAGEGFVLSEEQSDSLISQLQLAKVNTGYTGVRDGITVNVWTDGSSWYVKIKEKGGNAVQAVASLLRQA